jgi:hypothetical protein
MLQTMVVAAHGVIMVRVRLRVGEGRFTQPDLVPAHGGGGHVGASEQRGEGSQYCDGGLAGVGVFRLDSPATGTSPACNWYGYPDVPAVKFAHQ